jgi:hypothetical protein
MTMFGHLKAEDFTNLLEGATVSDRLQSHLKACEQCKQTFESVQEVRSQIEGMRVETDEFIPEPDWSEFRSDVRNTLLSRSVKRETASRRWLGGVTWKPALVWGFSMLLVFGITFGVVWNQRHTTPESTPIAEGSSSEEAVLNSLAVISQTDVFDDLVDLNADEAQSLQMILDDMAQEGVSQQ